MWQAFKDWLSEKIFEALVRGLGKVVKKINFEKAILISVILFFVAGLTFLVLGNVLVSNNTWVKFYSMNQASDDISENNLLVVDSSIDEQVKTDQNYDGNENASKADGSLNGADGYHGAEQEHILFNWSIYAFLGMVSVTVGFILFVGYILLRVEKGNNKTLFQYKRREIKKILSKQPNELLKIRKQFEREQLLPTTWGIPANGQASEEEKQIILAAYESMEKQILQAYEKLCLHIVHYVYPHVNDTSPKDAVHVSIKAISKNTAGEMIVISLGYAHQESGDLQPKTKEPIFKRWSEMVQESYLLKDDYALYRVCNDDIQFGVFTCDDLRTFASQQDKADRFGKFRRPDHIDRDYNATIVCPIYYAEKSKIHITGAICIDTTSSYAEWHDYGSYEEELITFVSSNIGPLMKHNINELNLAEEILRRVS